MIKKIVLAVFCMLAALNVFSQGSENYSYSIGLRGYSMMQLPKVLNQVNARDYVDAYLNGVMIKFNDNQISYRLKANYWKLKRSFFNNCRSCEIAEGTTTDYSASVGFEKNLNYGKLQPYIGTDIGFRISSFNGEINTVNPKSTNLPYNVDTDKSGLLVSPLVGVRYSPISQVSIFAETSLDFFFSYERQETIQQDAVNTRSFNKFNKTEYLLNPVSIGIQIQLSRKD